jgi:hypothetical protein
MAADHSDRAGRVKAGAFDLSALGAARRDEGSRLFPAGFGGMHVCQRFCPFTVTPAKAGVQGDSNTLLKCSGFRPSPE